jgi:tetratricopeptide (TPR) repeat protein
MTPSTFPSRPVSRTHNGPTAPELPAPEVRSAAEVLATAQSDRFVVQDFCPLANSLEWELGQGYFREAGTRAFIGEAVPVPFAINNNGNMSEGAAEVFFTSLVEAERRGPLEERIFVLELGIGVGLFARYFLDAFRDLCGRNGRDYYDRLTYIAGDYAEEILLDLCRHGVLADHPGRYVVRVINALYPERDLPHDLLVGPQQTRPLRAVFLNYLLDCLPAAAVEADGQEVRELYVRTCLARGVNLAEFTDLRAEDLARRACSSDRHDKGDLRRLFGLFTTEYDYRPADVGRLPYGEFIAQYARAHKGSVLHNWGALQCLERLFDLLDPQGFVLVNDYGAAEGAASSDFEHQRFAGATCVGINFGLLKAYFADVVRSQWVQPAEDGGHIYSRLLGKDLTPLVLERFGQRFGKAAFQWREEPVRLARACAEQGRYEAAGGYYRKALERQPRNWQLIREVALFLTFTLRSPAVGLELTRLGLTLNPTCSPDLWNAHGDCLFALNRFEESRQAYLRALELNPADVCARYNLAWVLIRNRDYAGALHLIAEALALDKSGTYHERLLQKQNEVLNRLAHRHQQEYQFMLNRITTYPARRKADTDSAQAEGAGDSWPDKEKWRPEAERPPEMPAQPASLAN